MEMILRRLEDGQGREVDLGLLLDVSDGISIGLAWPPKMTTICPLGPSAVSPIIALRDYFRDEVMEHVRLRGCWRDPAPRSSSAEATEGDRQVTRRFPPSTERGSGGRPPEMTDD